MNNDRRKQIAAIVSEVEGLTMLVEQLRERIEAVRDDEQDYFDNMPENFQDGDKGERAQTAIDALDGAISDLEGIDLDSVTSSLEEAAQ